MGGRHSTGAAASAVTDLVVKDRERRLNREDRFDQFLQRLALASQKQKQSGGEMSLDQIQGMQPQGIQQQPQSPGMPAQGMQPQLGARPAFNPFTGQRVQPQQRKPIDPANLPDGVVVRMKIPGGTVTLKRPAQKKSDTPKAPDYLTEQQAQDYLLPAIPGQPFPEQPMNITDEFGVPGDKRGGGLPATPRGFNTLQAAITQGRTESPAARIRPQLGNQQSGDPIQQRVQQLLQQGMDPEEIASYLQQKGIDPSQYGL